MAFVFFEVIYVPMTTRLSTRQKYWTCMVGFEDVIKIYITLGSFELCKAIVFTYADALTDLVTVNQLLNVILYPLWTIFLAAVSRPK